MSDFKSIFSVSPDVDRYLTLQETGLEMALQSTNGELIELRGVPQADRWQTVEVEWLIDDLSEEMVVPDIAAWGSTEFACSEPVADLLRPVLKDTCEFLPLSLNGERWYALHVLAKYNAINEGQTVLNYRANGKPSRVRKFKKLVLNASGIEKDGLFRIDGCGLATYCTDGPNGLFEAVKKHGLSGLEFNQRDVN
ncbi:hypothetical protein EZV61_13860 [Corallincola luteus]|uniref:Uncharacterized protein n=1 Tax=Corallincola luteus TaxID=1775177 RepID=A0ABY2AIC4_9GAMM|nr:hypothetical protein [Corallincola luteus]TCI02438.1 hypothetical protein EZV61_13860 [Corallincola luteus]